MRSERCSKDFRTSKVCGSACSPLVLLFLLATGCWHAAKAQGVPANSGRAPYPSNRGCEEAARRILGPHAEVLRCGDVSRSGKFEALAILRLKPSPANDEGIFVSRLVIINQQGSRWTVELDAGKEFKNPQGYVAALNDSAIFRGYHVRIWDHRSDGVKAFGLAFQGLDEQGYPEAAPTDIYWNPSVGRYQEFAYDESPPRFKPEVQKPQGRERGRVPFRSE